jgi:hypothetical protein
MTGNEKLGLALLGAVVVAGYAERKAIRSELKKRLRLFPDVPDEGPVLPKMSSPGTTEPEPPPMPPRPSADIFPDGQHYHLVYAGQLLGVFDTVEMAAKVADQLGFTAVITKP